MGLYTLTIILLFLLADILPQSKNKITNWSEPKFEHITVENGLSDNRVLSITQDSKGFLWFGTMDGLNKYDGYKFTIYRNDPNDSTSLTDNFITTIYEDHSGVLWIGTQIAGLCRYEQSRNVFIRYKSEKNNPNSLCGNQIVTIYETDKNILFIGSTGGLNKYNRETDNFTRYYPEGTESTFKTNVNYVGAITQDNYGRLWIATWNQGLFYYDKEKDKFIKYEPQPEFLKIFNNQFIYNLIGSGWNDKNYLWFTCFTTGLYKLNLQNGEINRYKHEPDLPNSISDNRIWSIYQSGGDSDELWIGTEQGGLNRFNIVTEKFTHYQHQPQNQFSINDNYVYSIFKDKSGLIWIGTTKGIDKFNPNPAKFKTIQLDTGNQEGLSGEIVWAIHESTKGGDSSIIWLGTEYGLFGFNRTNGRFTRFPYSSENMNSLSNNIISAIIETHSGNRKELWVSTENGLNKIDLSTNRITRYYIPSNDPVYNMMYALCEDKNGKIWMGTQSSYLYSFDPATEKFNKHSSYGLIHSIYMDSSGTLWIGTFANGLFAFNPATKEERNYRHIEGDQKSISSNLVASIMEDEKGILWIGTGAGLNKFDRSSGTFTCFSEKEGLISNLVRAVLADGNGNLWLSTDKGISKFNPTSNEFRNFTTKDGLHNNEFWGAAHMNQKGEMFFGGRNGLTYFHPDSIKDNTHNPTIVLTDFQIFNKSVRPGKDLPLKKQISEVKDITLSHDQSIFSFEFAALEYYKPEKIKYAYKMENIDPDWVFIDASRRFVTYTQLDPGEYVFRVKATNSDGIWNKQMASVNIIILPPWWETWWAYLLYALFALGLLYSIRRYELNRVHLKNQVKLDEVKLKEREETDRMKSHFFANISHEFRTPLTLILGPSENILEEAPSENATKQAGAIKRNAKRLLGLINQLLDLSRLEAGRLELKASKNNIVSFIKGITMSFESIAEKKDITLKVKTEKDDIELYFDKEKMTKIMTNLLSNAFKFTNNGDLITVTINESENNSVAVKVKDNGVGIAEDEIQKLFDRFYQVDSSQTREYEGTGIGLALTKELVELHHGRISADSKLGEWTEFTIELPVGKSHLRDEEIIEENVILSEAKNLSEQFIDEITFEDSSSLAPQNDSKVNEEKNIILVVEDNSEVREFIKDSLENDFQIEEASNGEQGIKKAEQIIPDLIISDVMMPKMDGNELTKKLKNNERTSHIPIILLTAKSEQQSKLEGLKTGADDYLTKPFDIQELRIRINNLIQQRQKLRERFMREIYLNPKEVTVTSIDERFLLKASEVVEKKISDPEFSVDNFVKEMGLSRTNLYLKLNALTGLSAKEFIRTIRLKRAAHLLRNHYGRISEIAYEVGFNNPSYFAECFQKQFQQLPSQYKSKYTDQSSM